MIAARGRRRRRYRAADYRTPYEKLLALPDWQKHLKDGVRPETLLQQAGRHSDTAAAQRMQKAKLALLARCRLRRSFHRISAALEAGQGASN